MHEASSELTTAAHWVRREDGRIECRLCPHHCVLRDKQIGLCKVRQVHGGELKALGYGLLSAAHVDPVEKKPLYHFHPGKPIYSIGGWGCNFACMFCQNWTISQQIARDGARHAPQDVVAEALSSGSRMLAFTYNEPLIGFEFVRDCARLARAAGLRTVLVTNGYVEEAPAAELLPLIDALNVDIKSMAPGFYRRQCRGTLEPVLAFCRQAVAAGCHLEITNLLIPTLNVEEAEVEELATWIKEHLGPLTPLHLSAYHPDFESRIEATPVAALEAAFAICRRHLTYVYMGNVFGAEGQNTVCPGCGNAMVVRKGYSVKTPGLRRGACAECGRKADIVA